MNLEKLIANVTFPLKGYDKDDFYLFLINILLESLEPINTLEFLVFLRR
jgi:hypothetical protein